MKLLALELHVVRALNTASEGALYRMARSQLARDEEPEILVVRAPPVGTMPVRWFLSDATGEELVELRTPEALALAAHVFLQDHAARLRTEIMARFAPQRTANPSSSVCKDG